MGSVTVMISVKKMRAMMACVLVMACMSTQVCRAETLDLDSGDPSPPPPPPPPSPTATPPVCFKCTSPACGLFADSDDVTDDDCSGADVWVKCASNFDSQATGWLLKQGNSLASSATCAQLESLPTSELCSGSTANIPIDTSSQMNFEARCCACAKSSAVCHANSICTDKPGSHLQSPGCGICDCNTASPTAIADGTLKYFSGCSGSGKKCKNPDQHGTTAQRTVFGWDEDWCDDDDDQQSSLLAVKHNATAKADDLLGLLETVHRSAAGNGWACG